MFPYEQWPAYDYSKTEPVRSIHYFLYNLLATAIWRVNADEHLATRVVFSALHTLSAAMMPVQPSGLKAICCGVEGDLHELPVQLSRIILESEGWEVQSLGPNTPLFALSEMVNRQRPQRVCIIARSISDLDRATAEYSQLRKITRKLGVSVVIGGEGFSDSGFRERFTSEFYAGNL
jgi:methanogenic corrinoid protein MtbC1